MEHKQGERKIAVLFGGVSSEHGISLISATTVLQHLDAAQYAVYPIGITEQGAMYWYRGSFDAIASGEWEKTDCTPCVISPDRTHHGLLVQDANEGWRVEYIDCVFPMLHGKNGEDGTVQGLLQMAGIPFVGCDMLSSALCMDKETTHVVLERAGIPMTPWISVRDREVPGDIAMQVALELGYPVFVKPANAGSSYGVSKVETASELQSALTTAFAYDSKVLIEQNVVGREVECAVLGNRDARASVIGEICSANTFYDFEAKYENKDSKLLLPAPLPDGVTMRIRELAVRAFLAAGCSGLSRVDFFVTEQDEVLLNEINTIPGFTSISMYPKLWEHCGLPIAVLLDRLIDYAMQ